ncbi:MAG: chemotaxis-specific protein-glutamate methyltransferase CheB [Lachnospiraceae bacterium]|nr:chemotaxis-specific protein-glutamate methyltransferase CheB [Lachnospiraceae bacterium]
MKKKILIVDDSALMRRVLCDIINSDDRFEVADMAIDGAEGFKLIVAHNYDAVVLDVYMPRMTGLDMLREMQKSGVHANVMMASTTTAEGARETLDALELGAIDFIKKPENVADARHSEFRDRFLSILDVVSNSRASIHRSVSTSAGAKRTFSSRYDVNFHNKGESDIKRLESAGISRTGHATDGAQAAKPSVNISLRKHTPVAGEKIVAIASSTGGPRALQDVIPKLPANLNAPVLLVQHMPKGFTKSLAERLNELSPVTVTEAVDGETIEKGHVYIAPGGQHMKLKKKPGGYVINLSDEPAREGVKPCANYMYESLMDSDFAEITCAVLTGMGQDGTVGIKALEGKKKIYCVAQDEDTSTVYGMPKAIALTGLCNSVVPLLSVADQIIKNVGVR